MLTLLPAAKVGFIGLYRDEETLQPVEYFCKLPQDIAERDVLVLDPMLATGGSAIDAITQIKKHGAKRIKFIGLIADVYKRQVSDHSHKELSANEVLHIFEDAFLNRCKPLNVLEAHFAQVGGITATVTLELNGQRKVVTSVGNGRLDAVANAIQRDVYKRQVPGSTGSP